MHPILDHGERCVDVGLSEIRAGVGGLTSTFSDWRLRR